MTKRTFQIYRYDPDTDAKPYMQSIDVELDGSERMLLDALMKLKSVDPAISLRRSCREGVCGSDAMNINGKNGLACLTNMRDLPGVVVLKPLPGLPVIRDLIVDMTQFFKQYNSIKPYLVNDSVPPEKPVDEQVVLQQTTPTTPTQAAQFGGIDRVVDRIVHLGAGSNR